MPVIIVDYLPHHAVGGIGETREHSGFAVQQFEEYPLTPAHRLAAHGFQSQEGGIGARGREAVDELQSRFYLPHAAPMASDLYETQ